MAKTVIVTGGAGFIGSEVVRQYISQTKYNVVNVDKLTYAGSLEALAEVSGHPRHYFEHVDICNSGELMRIFEQYQPDAIMHLAAESHVDRSIEEPAAFIQTNIVGTYTMLEVARKYWNSLDTDKKNHFRFHHVSTDEVYGALGDTGLFTEETPYSPNSPYSASKASSDHLVRAWFKTYEMPVIISNSSNSYGPYQYPDKLVPRVILNAISGKPIPLYGKGNQRRDWLYLEDHANALRKVLEEGVPGKSYNIGANNEMANIDLVKVICSMLDDIVPIRFEGLKKYDELITFVADRPGHDHRYALDTSKISQELKWKPRVSFGIGIKKTIKWYLNNKDWRGRIDCELYRDDKNKIDSLFANYSTVAAGAFIKSNNNTRVN